MGALGLVVVGGAVGLAVGLAVGWWLARRRGTGVGELERLRDEARSDPLTGLWNRRGLDESLARLAVGTSNVLLLVDIDGLKPLNDTHGHAAGDRALVAVARALEHSVRGGDIACRWGGDEFAVVLVATDLDDGRSASGGPARVLEAVESAAGGMTVSLGMAAWTSGREDPGEAWRRADQALYAAKQHGGDRLACHDGTECMVVAIERVWKNHVEVTDRA